MGRIEQGKRGIRKEKGKGKVLRVRVREKKGKKRVPVALEI